MKNRFLFTSILASSLLILSCTTMGEHECKSGDWKKAGQRDALAGRAKSHLKYQNKACNRFKIKVDKKEYYEGHDLGLKKFCTYKSGYEYGLENNFYHDSCPADLEESFFKGYTAGKKQHTLNQISEEQED